MSSDEATGSGRPRRATLVLLCTADLLVTLDGTVVTVALPAIQRELGTSADQLQWVVTAYTLTLGAFMLIGGRAGDLYGARRVLVGGLLVFAVASAGAGLAGSTELLLSMRALQGLGAAFAIPAALAILAATYREERARERAIGYLSMTLDAGMVAGLILGGVLTATVGWPWCFFLVVPIGLAAAALAPGVLPERREHTGTRLDLLGAVLAAAGFATLAVGIAELEHDPFTAAALIAGALALLAVFVRVERRSAAPMVRLSVFRHRPLTGANLAIIANAGGFGGMMYLATLQLQQVHGFTAWQAGLAFVPLAVSAGAGGLLAPHIVARLGPRRTAAASMLVAAAAFLLLTQSSERAGYWLVPLPAFLLGGFAFAAAFVPLTSQGMTGVGEGEKGLASGLLQTSTHLGGALVLTVLAVTAVAGSSTARDDGASGPAALLAGYSAGSLVAAVLLIAGAVIAVRTLPTRRTAS